MLQLYGFVCEHAEDLAQMLGFGSADLTGALVHDGSHEHAVSLPDIAVTTFAVRRSGGF